MIRNQIQGHFFSKKWTVFFLSKFELGSLEANLGSVELDFQVEGPPSLTEIRATSGNQLRMTVRFW